MGFGSNFFGAATEALPLGAQVGVRGIENAQDFEEKKRQRELKKKSSFDKAIESGTFLMGLTKNPGSLSKGFKTIGNAIPDEFPEAKAAMEAFSLAVIREPKKVAEAWKQVSDYQKFANSGDNAGAAVSLSKFELLASDLGIQAAQIINAMGNGVNDFNKTRSDAAMRSKQKDFELEQSTQQTKDLHSLRNLVSSLEQAKKYDKNTADLEKKIFRIVDLMQIQASKSGSPEFINNTTAKLRAIAPDFISDVAGEVRRTAIAKEAGKPDKPVKIMEKIKQKIVDGKPLTQGETQLFNAEFNKGKSQLSLDKDGNLIFTTGGSDVTPTNLTFSQAQLDVIANTRSLISDYKEQLKSSKQVGGIGSLRRFLQGAGEQLDAFRDFIARDVDLGKAENAVAGLFDPSLPKLEFLANEMAYSLARSREPNARLSVQDVKSARDSLQMDKVLTGKKSVEAVLEAFEKRLDQKAGTARRRIHGKNAAEKRFKELNNGERTQAEIFGIMIREGY